MMKLLFMLVMTLGLFTLSGVSAQQLRSPTAGVQSFSPETTDDSSSHFRIRSHVDGAMRGLWTKHGRKMASAFAQCSNQEGTFDLGGYCFTFPQTLITGAVSGGINFNSDSKDGQVQAFYEDVLQPIKFITNALSTANLTNQNFGEKPKFCLGDFEGSAILEDKGLASSRTPAVDTPICAKMPLKKDAEWSIFSFKINIPPGLSAAVCKIEPTAVTLEACVAVSECEGLPSVAVVVNGGMIGCLAGQAAAPSAGLSSAFGSGSKIVLDSVSAGYSLTNAFEISIWLYNGRNLLRYKNTPTFYQQVKIGINATRLKLPDFFSLTGTLTRRTTIAAEPGFVGNLEDTIESILGSFDGSVEKADVLDEIADKMSDLGISVEAVAKASLTGTLKIRNIKVIGAIFPNFNVELFEANMHFLLATEPKDVVVDSGKTEKVYPGVSIFAGTAFAADFIKKFVEFIRKSVGGILNLLPSWCPIDLDVSEILSADKINIGSLTENDVFGAGVTFNTDRTGFLINVPLLIDELGQVKVNCYTDYNKFNCEVKANADGLLTFFTGIVEDYGEAALWVARLTGETFEELGPVVAASFIDAASEIQDAFDPKNLENTGQLLADGTIDLVGTGFDKILSLEEAAVVGAVMNTVLNPAAVLGPIVDEGVQQIAEWGEGLVDQAEKAYEGAKAAVDKSLKVADNLLNCVGSLYSPGSLSPGCGDFIDLGNALAAGGGKVLGALDKAWTAVTDFFKRIADCFFCTISSYEYRFVQPTVYGKYNCRVQNIRKVTRTKVGPFSVSTTRKTVGQTVEEACVKRRLEELSKVNFNVRRANLEYDNFLRVESENLDALAGVTYSTDASTFVCTSRWIRGDATDAGEVPLEVTCSTPQIMANGTISTETLSATKSLFIKMDADLYFSIPTIIETLTSQTRTELVNIITNTMTRKSLDCEPTSGPAGDKIDNDCNGLVDDSILCDFEDHILGDVNQFWKDCKCAPPVLANIADVTIACNADYTTTAIGTPAVTLRNSGDAGCPASGSFLGEIDSTDYLNTCGDAIATRIHQYADGLTQRSNTVTQTVTLTKVPPVLNETLIDELVFVDSTVEVKNGMGLTIFLAPDAEVPEELGVSVCASILDEYFLDLNIDYVGCPENPEDIPNGKYKGWNVKRQWIVEDECGQLDTHIQTIVRTDEVAPTLDMPLVRVQSCRASYDPMNTGYPIASDQSDPADVLNPRDWSVLPLADGRISYSDSGDLDGCEQDFVREFVVNDRVCNEFSDSHVIQSSSFDFRPRPESTTEYDPSSLLPTFEYDVMDGKRQIYDDVVKFNFGINDDTDVDGCLETSVEFLDSKRQDAVWTLINSDFANGVFKVDDGSDFTIQINENRRLVYQDIVNASVGGVGVFRMSLSCFSVDTPPDRRLGNGKGPRDLHGTVMFKLKLK